MTDQQAREFVEMLAVPQATDPPPCPICGSSHQLEVACILPRRDRPVSALAPNEGRPDLPDGSGGVQADRKRLQLVEEH